MYKVRKTEKIIPEIKTIPIVNLDSYPAPDPITRGMIPTTVDKPVMIIGLNLLQELLVHHKIFAFSLSCLANSILKYHFLVLYPSK